ncbi:hypothetical protein KDX23_26435 [Burkholderia vietnamiensis]|nr:hypothetical protein [Burkholderia vietnamiensis]
MSDADSAAVDAAPTGADAATNALRYLPTAVPISPATSRAMLAWPRPGLRSMSANAPKIAANATTLSAAFLPGPHEGFGGPAGESPGRSPRVIRCSSVRADPMDGATARDRPAPTTSVAW